MKTEGLAHFTAMVGESVLNYAEDVAFDLGVDTVDIGKEVPVMLDAMFSVPTVGNAGKGVLVSDLNSSCKLKRANDKTQYCP